MEKETPLDASFLDEKKLVFYLLAQKGVGKQRVKAILDKLLKRQIKPKEIRRLECLGFEKDNCLKYIYKSIKWSIIEDFYYSSINSFKLRAVSVAYYKEKCFPSSLRTIADTPLLIFYRGDLSVLKKQSVAIVGTRKITAYGSMVTKKITAEVVSDGFVTISGCMYGVDRLAHQETIRRKGKTVGVLGYGFDFSYPASAQHLCTEIIRTGGLVVTEYFPWTEPRPGFFLARNRIIAGLAQATIVTEAAQRSGSHRTAISAAENGRSVFAVPGPITNPYSEGTKWLVNQGATLITSGFQVAEYLGIEKTDNDAVEKIVAKNTSNKYNCKTTTLSETLLELLKASPQSTEELTIKTKMVLSDVLCALGHMELDGLLVKDGILWYLK